MLNESCLLGGLGLGLGPLGLLRLGTVCLEKEAFSRKTQSLKLSYVARIMSAHALFDICDMKSTVVIVSKGQTIVLIPGFKPSRSS